MSSDVDRGLDDHGWIRREGRLESVHAEFQRVVAAVADGVEELLWTRLHSLYLYGSVPRGTAEPGRSDLDLQAILHTSPQRADRAALDDLEQLAGRLHPEVTGIGILLNSRPEMLAPANRYDGAFHLSCLCTPLRGPDLGIELPRQRPTVALARGISGDVGSALQTLLDHVEDPNSFDAEIARRVGRRLARLAFTVVMPRWNGWTSHPAQMAAAFDCFYPDRAADMRSAVALGWHDEVDQSAASDLLRGFGGWLLAERDRVLVPLR